MLELEKVATEWGDQATDASGRKLRKDGHCLLAGVISLPDSEKAHWQGFKKRSIEWLKEQYGDRLKTVVEHTDERHPHLHFYCVPNKGESFEVLHQGQQAAKKAKAEGKKKGEQNTAYIEAMRKFQDLFSQLAQKYGLTRIGPGRRRLTREQWKAEQQQARALADVRRKAKRYEEGASKKGYEEGLKKGLEKSKTFGFAELIKGSWNKPSKEVVAENEKLKEEKEEAEKKALEAKEEAKKYLKLGIEKQKAYSKLEQERLKDQSVITKLKNEIAERDRREQERLERKREADAKKHQQYQSKSALRL